MFFHYSLSFNDGLHHKTSITSCSSVSIIVSKLNSIIWKYPVGRPRAKWLEHGLQLVITSLKRD